MKTKNVSGGLNHVVKRALPVVSDALKSLFANITEADDAKKGLNFYESFAEISINGIDYQLQIHAVSNTDTWAPPTDFVSYETYSGKGK